jgi:hypothetical protein
MKAKELAKILSMTPDAEVVHYEYTGGDTPVLPISTCVLEEKGEKSESYDGGYFIDKNGILEKDIVILG